MAGIFARAKKDPMRVVYAEGEEERVLQACQAVIHEGLARPILIGRPSVVQTRIERLGLRMQISKDFELVDPQKDDRYPLYWQLYQNLMERKGISPDDARMMVRTSTTVIAALMVVRGDADAFICGSYGQYMRHLHHVKNLIGLKVGASVWGALSAIVVEGAVYFITDTYVNEDPSASEIAEITLMAIEQVREFGFTPKVALLSHSNFARNNSSLSRISSAFGSRLISIFCAKLSLTRYSLPTSSGVSNSCKIEIMRALMRSIVASDLRACLTASLAFSLQNSACKPS
jgi:malate dehydrogenase (oxaloacetate-decarboxylating)(NADP+)